MDEQMLIKKNKRNSTSFLLVGILLMTLTLGISFSFFYYNKQLENDIQIIAGSVYLEANYQDDVTLSMMYPMSDEEGIENGAKYQLNIRGHNEFEKDLYYGIYLNQGVEQEGKIRLKDDEIKVYLTKTQDKETKVVYGPGTLKDFNDKLIHTSVINEKTNRDEEVSIDYELTLWVDEKVLISNTIKEEEGRRIYTQEEFANSYATVVPTVKGDYKEKDVDLDVNAIGILTTSNKEYDISKNYYETEFTDENVKVEISSEKEVSKFVITNAVTNEIVEKEPTIVNGKSIVELEYTESGSYVYYGVYEDGTTSEIDTYNIKIDKNIPTFVMETGKVANVENSETFYKIENKLTIEEENNYEVFYALVEKGKEVEEYNKIELDEENKIVVNTKSGLWDLVVKVRDEAKKEKVLRETYTISYTVDIINNNSDVNLERTTQKLVLGQTFNYIEELPVITNSDFIGYATDSKGINLIKEESIVKPDIQKIYAIYQDIGLIVKPTNNSCLDIVYNGEEQVLTKDASNEYVFNQNTGINAGSYTVVASLKEGYTWKDNTTEDVEITCNIEKVKVTYKADDANKVYDGTALTKQTATLKSGSLVNGHTATFTIEGSITNPGTGTNTLKEVIIKNTNGNDVTENYEITKENGTLTITSAKAEIPTNSLCVSRTYTGNEQQLTSVTSGTGYTLSGYNQTTAGTHTITATLANGYVWSDDTTGTKTFTCSITYETYNVTLNNQSAESAGTTTLYGRYADGVYLDSSYSNKVTTSANAVTIPTKTGYTFDGYYTSENGGGTQLINASGNITSNFTTTLYNSNVTLYAKWTANSYTVTYDSGNYVYGLEDKESTVDTRMTYSVSNKVVTVTANQDDGYGFTNGRVYLIADKTYMFSIETNGTWGYATGEDTVEAILLLNGNYDTSYHMKQENYTFTPTVTGEYWLRLDVNQKGKTYTFSDITIKEVSTTTVTYNSTYGTLGTTPTRAGYTFNGWYTSETGGTQVTSSTKVTSTSNHTLYAHWTVNTYNNYFVGGQGTITNGKTLTNLIKNGGFENGTTNWTLSNASVTSNQKYSGNYSLQLNANANPAMATQGLSKNAPTLNHKYYGRTMFLSSSSFTEQDDRFEWFTNDEVGGKLTFARKDNQTTSWITKSSVLTQTVSTYLSNSWYIRNFIVNGSTASYADDMMLIDLTESYGSGSELTDTGILDKIPYFEGNETIYSKSYTYGSTLGTLPTVTREGYTFNGWYTQPTGGTQITTTTGVPVGNTVYYAQWTSWPTATIPTNSLCVSRTYTGAAQQLTSATSGTGYTLSGYSQTNAGTYTITATLASGYKWTDNTLGTKTFTCSMAPKPVTYKADSASKVYDGTALTKQSASLVSGSLVSGHTASFSITGSQISAGSSTNTLNSVTIKDSSGNNVTSNYSITKQNGTLTVKDTLYNVIVSNSTMDNVSSEFVTASTGVDFYAISSDTNGKGIYMRAGTENNQYPVAYYRGEVDNNNVLFANYCWKAYRTTDTGGVKLIYNGLPSSYVGETGAISLTDYTVVTNTETNPFTFDTSDNSWNVALTNTVTSVELSFKVNIFNTYIMDVYGTTPATGSGGGTLYKDSATVNGYGGGGGNNIVYQYNYGTLTTDNVIKITLSGSPGVTLKVKMMRPVKIVSGECNNTGTTTQLPTKSVFNSGVSPAYMGYMYGTVYVNKMGNRDNVYFGTSFTYTNGVYKLVNPQIGNDSTHRYTCNSSNADETCATIRYHDTRTIHSYYIELTDGKRIEDAYEEMHTNTNDSTVKTVIDNWYEDNLTNYTPKLEDTNWCNDRRILNEGYVGGSYAATKRENNIPVLECEKNDSFTVNETEFGNGDLTYPIALITADEVMLAGGLDPSFTVTSGGTAVNKTFYLYINEDTNYDYWTMTPSYHSPSASKTSHYRIGNGQLKQSTDTTNLIGVRPSVSLKYGAYAYSGDGTATSPYVIRED